MSIYVYLCIFVGELIKDDNDDGENRPDVTHPTSGVQIKLYTVHPK